MAALIAVVAAGSLVATSKSARCDDPTNLAPPVGSNDGSAGDDGTPDVAPSNVFNWQEVPVNQQVPIESASFDEGGYQLSDTVGETILVRFKDDNLYVMKFAVSDNGAMYFVNTGSTPVLYVPQDGYLTNATVSGSRWYPFTDQFQPTTPVFLGIAPSWSEYVDTGWYPGMYCYGGYWNGASVGAFEPSYGLYISFGGRRFNDWNSYGDFLIGEPAPLFMGFYHQGIYHYGARSYWGSRSFHGTYGQSLGGHVSVGGHQFSGGGQGYQGGGFRGANGGSQHSFNGAGNGGSTGGFRGGYSNGSPGSNGSSSFRGGNGGNGGYGGAPSHSGGGYSGGGSNSGGSFAGVPSHPVTGQNQGNGSHGGGSLGSNQGGGNQGGGSHGGGGGGDGHGR